MRVSVNKKDRGFRYGFSTRRIRVFLDGTPVENAITADEEEGMVLVYRYGEDGEPVVDHLRQGFVLDTLRGKVRVDVLGADGGSLREPRVRLEPVPGGLEVLVYSRMSPRNVRRTTVPDADLVRLDDGEAAQYCGVLAGAAAEHLCAWYGDLFDPSTVAQAAVDAMLELRGRGATRH